VGPERAGLGSGVNDTARKAGGAVGIAVYGSVAGPGTQTGRFLSGLHMTGLATCALFLAAALATVIFIPGQRAQRQRAAHGLQAETRLRHSRS
jgi:MFS transporter, DHA2 family, methylenomycin A resistance protein